MAFVEKMLKCVECGSEFAFTVQEQELHALRGYTNEPRRCPSCRESRRSERRGSGGMDSWSSSGMRSEARQMFPAVCASCGKPTEVPFQPRGDRPVYCPDCYRRFAPQQSRDRRR